MSTGLLGWIVRVSVPACETGDVTFLRSILVSIMLVGALGAVGPYATHAEFTDNGTGTAVFNASDSFNQNDGPIANAGGTYEVYEGESVQLDGTDSVSQGGMDSYEWEIVAGPGTLADSSTSTPTYNAPASVQNDTDATVELTVTNQGESDTDQATVTVLSTDAENQPPIARFTSDRKGQSSNVELDGTSSSDPDGTIEEYHWEWVDADGNTVTDDRPSFQRSIPRGTSVTLTVTDNDGATDSVTKTV